MPGGRPTKYNPSFDEKICELAEEGKGPAEWAYELGVDRSTLYRWAQEHDSFATAIARAKDYEMAAWERLARENIKDRNFNAQVWSKSMSSRFPRDYTERKEIDQRNYGLPVNKIDTVTFNVIDPQPLNLSNLSDEQLKQLQTLYNQSQTKVINHDDDNQD